MFTVVLIIIVVFTMSFFLGGGGPGVVRWAGLIKRGWVLFEGYCTTATEELTLSEVGQLCLDLAGHGGY